MKKTFYFALAAFFLCACTRVAPPAPCGPVPSERQLSWQQLEIYAFAHFNMNTFTDMEWGYGDEKPASFNPVDFDADQWARTFKQAGFKGLILTAKHHDGFCLWPSAYTEHSVKNSPWKDGKGDIVREVADACREQGLLFGVYLSPWDRNRADYATPSYVEYYQNQLRELLTDYGPIFEVWFDGANGGDGYYGGAREARKIDQTTYYQWDKTYGIVRELQPQAVIFGDEDVRWVGTEQGYAYPTHWSTVSSKTFSPGREIELDTRLTGQQGGDLWRPSESDVSIRPGWYYHPKEDNQVKSVGKLLDIYYATVGRNSALLLNLTPDNRGLIPAGDSLRLQEFAAALEAEFSEDLLPKGKLSASNVRGGSKAYAAKRVSDGSSDTYWATDDDVKKATLTVEFDQPTAFNRVLLQEYIPLGQRVSSFRIEALLEGEWQTIAVETTIGYKRILRLPTMEASAVRLSIDRALACPTISAWQLFLAPERSK